MSTTPILELAFDSSIRDFIAYKEQRKCAENLK